jgi:hypothetical protein
LKNKIYIYIRKGALVLYSEEVMANEKDSALDMFEDSSFIRSQNLKLNEPPIKTLNELQKNVLYYGMTFKEVASLI